jgi:two-component system, OmpR family, KDP operon response regulator KdpE
MDKRTILVVDDEPDVLKVLSKGLSAHGYDVTTADNGKDALMITREKHPDLVILDILMPDISGGSVGLTLQEDPATRDIPIIFLSCTFGERGKHQARPLFAGHIRMAKPYDMQELLDAVADRLAHKASHP